MTAVFCFASLTTAKAQTRKKSEQKPKGHPAARKAVRNSNHHPAPRRVSRESAKYRARRRARARRESVHLSEERVTEIQQALAKAGYFKGQADGNWGPETSEAMRQFQQANGFDATGLPEAKALMKLGLGPHPLPPSLVSAAPNAGTPQASAVASPSTADSSHTDQKQN